MSTIRINFQFIRSIITFPSFLVQTSFDAIPSLHCRDRTTNPFNDRSPETTAIFFFHPGLQSTPLIARFHPYKYASTRNSTIQTIFKLGGADHADQVSRCFARFTCACSPLSPRTWRPVFAAAFLLCERVIRLRATRILSTRRERITSID